MNQNEKYKDLENLLFKGFVPYKTEIGGINLVFKSINELEFEKINLMSGMEDDPYYVHNFNINYFLYSIYMVNGTNILYSKDNQYQMIFKIINEYPSFLIKEIFNILEYLSIRSEKSSGLIESYSYELHSRYVWKYKKGLPLNSHTQTGIQGTELLGLNQFQKYWSVLNAREDTKEAFEEKYNLAKFVASFTDPKGVKRIDSMDKKKLEEEEEKRELVKQYGSLEEAGEWVDHTHTSQGIIRELEKQMRGEQDDHDRAIEEHEKEWKKNILRQKMKLKKMRDKSKNSERLIEESRPISEDEMAEKLMKMRERSLKHVTINSESEEKTSKYIQMFNVKDEDLIKESDFMDQEQYDDLVKDEVFGGALRPSENDGEDVEEEYLKNQKKLASDYGYEDLSDFPHLRNK